MLAFILSLKLGWFFFLVCMRKRRLHYSNLFLFTVSDPVSSLMPPVQAVLSLSVMHVRGESSVLE